MSPPVLSRKQVRAVDRIAIEEYGMPGVVLMENAARGCVDLLLEQGVPGPVAVCAGKGNNGGDGFAIARHLANRGIDVRILLLGEAGRLTGDAAINYAIAERAGIPICSFVDQVELSRVAGEIESAEWVVDALLGTGMQGAVREPFGSVISAVNRSAARVLAVDVPSGIDCDLGVPADESKSGCVRADCTATFVARKLGFENPRSVEFTGEVHVVDIGVPHVLFQEFAATFSPES